MKPSPAQLKFMRRVAEIPNGSFHEQFPYGAHCRMRTTMEQNKWVVYEGGGYRLTDSGYELIKIRDRNTNPVRQVSNPYQVSQKDINKAYKLYHEFRESPPDRGRVVEFEMPKTLMVMGNVKAIEYDTTRGRKLELYRHDFAAGSRPLLCADAATGALFIIEGRYRVTKRGIVDLTPDGKEIDD
jgi:hypothetical protein